MALSVNPGVAWPRRSLTTLMGTCSFNMSEACVWRRS